MKTQKLEEDASFLFFFLITLDQLAGCGGWIQTERGLTGLIFNEIKLLSSDLQRALSAAGVFPFPRKRKTFNV